MHSGCISNLHEVQLAAITGPLALRHSLSTALPYLIQIILHRKYTPPLNFYKRFCTILGE